MRVAREANIFMVFVILDNPTNKDSVLDIRVPIFRPGKPPKIKSYMEQFPFPFYIMPILLYPRVIITILLLLIKT